MALMPTRVVILGRVSRGERTQDPRTQVEALEAVAGRKGWEVAEVVEVAKSAWDQKAAQEVHSAVMKPIIEGRADVLMVWSLDRLVRGGVVKAFTLVRDLEEHYGAQLFSLQEPFLSTASKDPSIRELLLAILAWVAKWESSRKSQRLKEKAAYKRRAAEKLGQRARWGRGKMASMEDREVIRSMLAEDPRPTQRQMKERTGLSLGSVNRLVRELLAEQLGNAEVKGVVPVEESPDSPPKADVGEPMPCLGCDDCPECNDRHADEQRSNVGGGES